MEMFGRNYEEIGSSDKGLIIKNSGKVKIQWGKSFIDLLDSNGNINVKVKSLIKEISSESQMKSNGFYLLNNNLFAKIGEHIIQLSSEGNSVCISFLDTQNLTSDQKYRVLQNIGFIYKTLEGATFPTNGIIYNESDQSLYIVTNGNLSKYSIGLPNPYPEQIRIVKDNDSEGSLVIEGEGVKNGILINSLRLYTLNYSSIIEADKELQLKILNKKIAIININGIKSDSIQSFDYSQYSGYDISKENNLEYKLTIDNIKLRKKLDYDNNNVKVQINNGLYSNSNTFVGAEFIDSENELELKNLPHYQQSLLENTSELLKDDKVILPTKLARKEANYIEDLTSKTTLDNNIYTLTPKDFYDGKLFIFKTLGKTSNDLKIRFNLGIDENNNIIYSQIFDVYYNAKKVKESELIGQIVLQYQELNNKIEVVGNLSLSKAFTGICSSEANAQIKEATVSDDFSLEDGVIVSIKFNATNTYSATAANSIKLKVNDSEAKEIWYNQSSKNTGTSNIIYGAKNRYNTYIYDAVNDVWVWVSRGMDSDTIPLRVYRQTSGYNGDYPILVSRTLAESIGTAHTNSSYSNVYGLIYDSDQPTINPSTGTLKAKTLDCTDLKAKTLDCTDLLANKVEVYNGTKVRASIDSDGSIKILKSNGDIVARIDAIGSDLNICSPSGKVMINDHYNKDVEMCYGDGNSSAQVKIFGGNGDSKAALLVSSGYIDCSYKVKAASFDSSSDERLKIIRGDIGLTIDQLASAPSILFNWKRDPDGKLNGGTIAQYWKEIAPWAVNEDSEGMLTVDYGALALAASIQCAKEILELKKKLELNF